MNLDEIKRRSLIYIVFKNKVLMDRIGSTAQMCEMTMYSPVGCFATHQWGHKDLF